MKVVVTKILLWSFVLLCNTSWALSTQWQQLSPGLSYTTLLPFPHNSLAQIHVFKIQLSKYKIKLFFAKENNLDSTYVSELGKMSHALIAINGGFFSPELKPLGLRIQNGVIKSPIKGTSWWGVFMINQQNKASINAKRKFRNSRNIKYALQAGPRLIINGVIPKLKPGNSERTALGITKSGDIIILVTQNSPISTLQLANIMKDSSQNGGLDCVNALNLDGGSSSQLYANIGQFKLSVPSIRGVADVIVVQRK